MDRKFGRKLRGELSEGRVFGERGIGGVRCSEWETGGVERCSEVGREMVSEGIERDSGGDAAVGLMWWSDWYV